MTEHLARKGYHPAGHYGKGFQGAQQNKEKVAA